MLTIAQVQCWEAGFNYDRQEWLCPQGAHVPQEHTDMPIHNESMALAALPERHVAGLGEHRGLSLLSPWPHHVPMIVGHDTSHRNMEATRPSSSNRLGESVSLMNERPALCIPLRTFHTSQILEAAPSQRGDHADLSMMAADRIRKMWYLVCGTQS